MSSHFPGTTATAVLERSIPSRWSRHSVVLTIGLSTLVQAWLGHRMAMVHGPNVIPSLAIVAVFIAGGEAYALQSFTAQAMAGIIIVALVYLGAVRYIRKVWSPLILGSMIIMIGLTVAEVGLRDMTQAGFGLDSSLPWGWLWAEPCWQYAEREFGRRCPQCS